MAHKRWGKCLTAAALAAMMDDLTGSEFDMKGLGEFQSLLKGE